MQHLKEKWLKLLAYYYAFFGVMVCGLYFITNQPNSSASLTITSTAAVIGLISIIYNLVVIRIVKKFNLWIAYIFGFVLVILASNAVIEGSSQSSLIIYFAINLCIISIASVAYGYTAGIATVTVAGVFYLMEVSGSLRATALGVRGDGIIYAVEVVGILLLMFLFRNHYVKDSDGTPSNYIERYFVDNEVVKLLTDSITDGVMILDSKGVIKSLNPGAALIFGQPQKDIIDLSYKSVLKLKTLDGKTIPDEQQPVQLVLSGKKTINQELSLQLKD